MTFLNKEPVQRVDKIIREFDQNLSVSVLKSKLLTIAPASHPKEDAASKAVLAEVSKTLTFKFWSNSLIILPTLWTGSLLRNVIIQL